MSALRVLSICHGHPGLVAAGTEHFAYDLHREMNGAELAESHFLACVTGLHRDVRDGTALQSLNGQPREFLLRAGRFDPLMLSHGGESETIASLARLLSTLKPDIVHFHHLLHVGAEALILVRRVIPSARIVFTLHDFHPICAQAGLMMKPSGALCHEASPDACHACLPELSTDRFALRRLHLGNALGLVDLFVAPSRTVQEKFVSWGIDPARIALVKGGVPTTSPTKDEPSRPRPSRFGFFGTIAPHKGVPLLLDAVSRLATGSDATLSLHGDDAFQAPEFRERFARDLRRVRDRAVLEGPYDRKDLDRLMGAVDWVVVPSLWWENAPLVILEAFARRKPVIAADVGGMAELVRHGVDGLLFRRGNPADLAQTMIRATEEAGLWASLRSNIARVPSVANAASAYAALYGRLVETRENERKRA